MQFMLKLHKRCQRWRRQYHQRSSQVRRCALSASCVAKLTGLTPLSCGATSTSVWACFWLRTPTPRVGPLPLKWSGSSAGRGKVGVDGQPKPARCHLPNDRDTSNPSRRQHSQRRTGGQR